MNDDPTFSHSSAYHALPHRAINHATPMTHHHLITPPPRYSITSSSTRRLSIPPPHHPSPTVTRRSSWPSWPSWWVGPLSVRVLYRYSIYKTSFFYLACLHIFINLPRGLPTSICCSRSAFIFAIFFSSFLPIRGFVYRSSSGRPSHQISKGFQLNDIYKIFPV